MAKKDKEKTAFVMRWAASVHSNAPANFERLMEIVLSGLQWKDYLVFLGDIITCGKIQRIIRKTTEGA